MSYLKKEVNNEGHLRQADKQQTFLPLDTIILGVCNQAYPKYLKQEVCISLEYCQKSMWDEVDFLSANKQKFFAS